jgi:SAM-dependent methyltransferase
VNPAELASRELIRPIAHRRIHPRSEPLSIAWLDELEHKRFARHGAWLPAALEFGRHPGESVLCLNPGLGADAIRFLQCGSEVTIGVNENEDVGLIRTNLERHALYARVASISGSKLPFADGAFDIVVVNGLYSTVDVNAISEEFFRILKCGGKVIGLFPAYYDAGYWQDLLLPYQHLYWRRPADPTTAPKTTARKLRRAFSRFDEHKVCKRHLRRSELPHICRLLPLVVLERLFGRVLVLKAKKPISAARVLNPLPAESLAA